jgi:hypothetical protein
MEELRVAEGGFYRPGEEGRQSGGDNDTIDGCHYQSGRGRQFLKGRVGGAAGSTSPGDEAALGTMRRHKITVAVALGRR